VINEFMSNLDIINKITEEKLPEIRTLILGLITITLIFISLGQILFNDSTSLLTRFGLLLFFILIWIVFWLIYKFKLPRNKKNRIGLILAIYTENETEKMRFKRDFVQKLRDDFESEGNLKYINIILLKNHLAKKLIESDDKKKHLDNIDKKINAHFYVFGDIRKRTDGDAGEKYFLHFNGSVRHKPIPQQLSNNISRDFRQVLPEVISFQEKDSFRGFEASAKIVHMAAKFIMGIAAFVSENPPLAYKLHQDLLKEFNSYNPLPKYLIDVTKRIPLFISDEANWLAKWHYENNRIDDAKKYLEETLSANPKHYAGWLLKAIIDFKIDKDPNESLKSIRQAELYSRNKIEWLYNRTFLYFWLGNFPEALRLCTKIRKNNHLDQQRICEDIRSFVLEILETDKSKPQLYFWIGYLSYFKQNNLCCALEDFENFENSTHSGMEILRQKSHAYLSEIKSKMKL